LPGFTSAEMVEATLSGFAPRDLFRRIEPLKAERADVLIHD